MPTVSPVTGFVAKSAESPATPSSASVTGAETVVRPIARVVGVTPPRATVTVGRDSVSASFGASRTVTVSVSTASTTPSACARMAIGYWPSFASGETRTVSVDVNTPPTGVVLASKTVTPDGTFSTDTDGVGPPSTRVIVATTLVSPPCATLTLDVCKPIDTVRSGFCGVSRYFSGLHASNPIATATTPFVQQRRMRLLGRNDDGWLSRRLSFRVERRETGRLERRPTTHHVRALGACARDAGDLASRR